VYVARTSAVPGVLLAGATTTALALFGVWALAHFTDENVMGWYANYVIPVGPILVGLVASSGFAVGSFASGAKITGRLLAMVLVMLVVAYALAQWLEFRLLFPEGAVRTDGSAVGFFDYFDIATRSIAFQEKNKEMGSPLGAWGYLVRLADVVGFAGGGVLIPLALRAQPYCAACANYMRHPVIALLPAGILAKRISKKDAAALAAREASSREAMARAEVNLQRVFASSNDPRSFAGTVDEVGPLAERRKTGKLTARVQVQLVHCRRCASGELRAALVTGQGKQMRTVPMTAKPLEKGVAPRLLQAWKSVRRAQVRER